MRTRSERCCDFLMFGSCAISLRRSLVSYEGVITSNIMGLPALISIKSPQSSVAQLVARSAVIQLRVLATGRFLVRSQAEEDCYFCRFLESRYYRRAVWKSLKSVPFCFGSSVWLSVGMYLFSLHAVGRAHRSGIWKVVSFNQALCERFESCQIRPSFQCC